jgi:hypothetical protein
LNKIGKTLDFLILEALFGYFRTEAVDLQQGIYAGSEHCFLDRVNSTIEIDIEISTLLSRSSLFSIVPVTILESSVWFPLSSVFRCMLISWFLFSPFAPVAS